MPPLLIRITRGVWSLASIAIGLAVVLTVTLVVSRANSDLLRDRIESVVKEQAALSRDIGLRNAQTNCNSERTLWYRTHQTGGVQPPLVMPRLTDQCGVPLVVWPPPAGVAEVPVP